jgi:hypothetical protein
MRKAKATINESFSHKVPLPAAKRGQFALNGQKILSSRHTTAQR